MTRVANALVSALANLAVLAGLPFLVYYLWHRLRKGRRLGEVARRAGLRVGEVRYIGYGAVFAALIVIALLVHPPSLESSLRKGSAFRAFAGLGLGPTALLTALIYGVAQTGFAEELLFRGLVAGSLSRRLSLPWADGLQAVVFLLPHLLLLAFAPETWTILPVIFLGALVVGWLRIRSGSILGPWLVHAAVNVTMALSVAVRSAT